MTVADLIFEAAVMGGMADPRDNALPPEEAAYGFRKLSDLIDELGTERLSMYREQRVGPFTVTSGMGDATVPSPITIGSGATWDTPRPLWIDRAGVIYTAGSTPRPELAMHVFTTEEWARVMVKGVTSTLPRSLFYDRLFNASGYGNLYMYPVPSASCQIVLYVPVAVSEFPRDTDGNPIYTTAVSAPAGYRSMYISHLAAIMCLGVVAISDDLREHKAESMARVKASNVVTHMDALSCDDGVLQGDHRGGTWDWINGGFA